MKSRDEIRKQVQSTVYARLSLVGIGHDVEAEDCIDQVMSLIDSHVRNELSSLDTYRLYDFHGREVTAVDYADIKKRIAELSPKPQEDTPDAK